MNFNVLKYLVYPLLVIFMVTCTESISDNPAENRAPDTFLFLYPDENAELNQQKSRLQVHWWGDDPDGVIIGFYFQWEGLDEGWTFTTSNDSIFALPIGTVDTAFVFRVIAADYQGNGQYDQSVIWNDTDLGPEPFIDENGNGIYDEGEPYYDIGLIDPTPATQEFPIKNTAPTIEWTDESMLPEESLPVITVGWNVDDLDGVESIVQVNLALNDTGNVVNLERSVRLVTLRIDDVNASTPKMQILINGSEDNIHESNLENLLLNDFNRLYIQAVDISGSKSAFVPLPDTTGNWYVQKPNGSLLIIDDYAGGSSVAQFYDDIFNSIDNGSASGKYNVMDIENTQLPYAHITFLETMKLFDYSFWYANAEPSLDILSLVTQKYLENNGKIAFTMTFQDSSVNFPIDLATLQNFLPIDSLGQDAPVNFMFPGANIIAMDQSSGYPNLETSSTISFVRTYYPSTVAEELHTLSSNQVTGNISLIDDSRSLFFIGLPLHQCDANAGSVLNLIEHLFIIEFGMSL